MKLRIGLAPTGLLHANTARLALATWLHARRHDAPVLLRLDDLDGAHVRDEWMAAIRHDLDWLGLDWDGEVRQSERLAAYAAAAERLKQAGRLYPCFESEEELRAKRDQRQRRQQPTIYDRAMLRMTAAQRAQAEAGGKRPYWRFLLSGDPAVWPDLVMGRQAVKLSAISDPVLVREDGTPLPLFAAAVDDLAEGITHQVQYAGDASATGLSIDVMQALGGRPDKMRFAHVPAFQEGTGPARLRRLPTLRSLRTDGIEPVALAGFLVGLDRAEPPAFLASRFDVAGLGGAAPPFETGRLLALNRRALAGAPFEAVSERLPGGATPAFWYAIRGGIDLLREARGWWEVAAGAIVPPVMDAEQPVLHAALASVPEEPWGAGTWEGWLGALREVGHEGEAALRLALTGEESGPELAGLLPLMGRERVVQRLRLAVA